MKQQTNSKHEFGSALPLSPIKEWTEIRLGDLIEVEHGWPFKGKLCEERLTGRPVVVNIGNFRYDGGFRFESTRVREYRGDYPSEYELAPADILLVMTCQTPGGEILGIPARIPDDGRTYLHNQRLGKIVIKDSDCVSEDFLYWLFRWSEFNRELYASASGTKILHTSPTRIKNFRFDLPRLPVQERIARILSALDDKIELNREMNRTLEAAAQAIFRSWFVDFDPVIAKADGRKPFGMSDEIAALFPDQFVESEMGPIPEGWRPTRAGEVMKIRDAERIPLSRSLREKRPGEYPYHGAAGVVDYIDDFIFDGIFLLLGEDGSVVGDNGRPVTQYVWGKIWVNNHAHVLQGKGVVSTEMLACFFRETFIAPYVTGAVQPKLNQRNLKSIPFLLAPDHTCAAFDSVAQSLFSRLQAAADESQTLAALRDLLLPKLLSGEIRVAEAERELEEAGV